MTDGTAPAPDLTERPAASHAHAEILSQPDTWDATIDAVAGQWRGIVRQIPPELWTDHPTHALFVGCGTSYYLAQTAAHVFQEMTGLVSRAVPGSEIVLSPASTLPGGYPVVAFVFSRSGASSEAVMAARYLSGLGGEVHTVGITCTPGSELVQATRYAIELPHADERSVVMTRSFTNMLLAITMVATTLGLREDLAHQVLKLPGLLRTRLDEMATFAQTLADRLDLTRVIYLGLGPYYGLAEEATLKLKEMTQVDCEPYNPLEFRHGAISMVGEDTLVVLLQGLRERAYMADLEADLKRYGATVATIGPYPSDHADCAIVLPAGLDDVTRALLYLPAVQLLANQRAVAMGLDPDAPRQLGKVVRLDAR